LRCAEPTAAQHIAVTGLARVSGPRGFSFLFYTNPLSGSLSRDSRIDDGMIQDGKLRGLPGPGYSGADGLYRRRGSPVCPASERCCAGATVVSNCSGARRGLAGIVAAGPIPAIHGVVRWRACDLIMRLYEEFGLSVSDDTIYRALKKLSFSHVSAWPKAYKQNAEAMDALKKLRRTCGGNPREARTRHTGGGLVPRRDAGGPKEQPHLSLG
jgi:hypothetical protein